MKQMNAAIVGCGNIGGLYDTPNSKKILTHAHAFIDSKYTKLIACCDIRSNILKKFTNIWGNDIHTYTSIELMLKNEAIDIIVIASNTDTHYEHLKVVLSKTDIKHIICEKPFVSTLDQYTNIITVLKQKKINLLINYIRCFDPSTNKIKKILKEKKLGEVLHFNSRINKGFYHNGSHLLSLIEHFFGKIRSLKAYEKKIINDDMYGLFHIKTNSIYGTMTNFHDTSFSIFDMDIVCTDGLIKITDSGFDIRVYKSNKLNNLKLYKKFPNTLQYYGKNTLKHLLNNNSYTQLNQHLEFSYRLLKIKNDLLTQKENNETSN